MDHQLLQNQDWLQTDQGKDCMTLVNLTQAQHVLFHRTTEQVSFLFLFFSESEKASAGQGAVQRER